MKKLLALMTLSVIANAEVFVIEAKHPLKNLELKQIQSIQKVTKVKKFLPFEDEYLNRVYEVHSDGDIQKDLDKLSFIKLAEKDHAIDAFEIRPNRQSELFTNDMLYPLQWALQSQKQVISAQRPNGGVDETEAVAGFDMNWREGIDKIETFFKKRPIVAVVDMGIDLDHPELKDAIFKNEVECDKGENGEHIFQPLKDGRREDRDRNGFPGDCMGWNFATDTPLFEVSPEDDTGHGTHVSGIIAAKRNNNIGISGLSDKIAILPLRVTGRVDETSDKDKLRYRSASRRIAKAIYYAARRRVDVINLSLGWPSSMDTQFMRNALREAEKFNVLVVAAAGNNNSKANIYPCAYENVVCVGSIDADGKMSRFSNYGAEVDVLAPGDQIVSTIPVSFIPLKLNIQGYDIMSGTSQAAPYVSGVAAILKSIITTQDEEGNIVPVPNAEIKRRLFDSAKSKVNPEKSQFGLVQLDEALKIGMAPSVRPIVKGFSEITYDPSTKEINNLSFGLENLGAGSPNIQVKIETSNPGVEFENNGLIKLEGMNRGQKIKLHFKAKVTDTNQSSIVPLNIKVFTPNLGVRSFYHEVYLSRSLDLADGSLMPIKLSNDIKLIAFRNEIQDSTIWTERDISPELRDLWKKLNATDRRTNINIRSVDAPYSHELPDFFLTRKVEDDVELVMIRNKGSEFKDSEVIKFPKTYQITDIIKMDFNYDGTEDYVVKSIEIIDNTSFKIVRTYLNKDLKPLFSGKSRIVKIEDRDSIKVTPQTQRFLKTKLPSGEYVAAPVFITTGVVPSADQIQDPWLPKDRSVIRRIYRLEINEQDGELVYVPRTFMNRDFVSKIRDQFSELIPSAVSAQDSGVELVALLNQTKEEIASGEVKALLSYGLGFARYNIELSFKDEAFSTKHLSGISSRLVGNALHEHIDLDNPKDGMNDSLVGFQTNSVISVSQLIDSGEKSYVYRLDTPYDRLQSFIASYSRGSKMYLFFETIDDILMVVDENGSQTQSRLNTTKFSFLPGTVMSDLFFPISLERENQLMPAIYVDTTAVVGQRIYAMTAKDDKLTTPMDLSIQLPQVCGVQDRNCGLRGEEDTKYCLPLNPLEDAKGHHSFMLLCKLKEDYFIKKVDL
tara:strand:+ start:112883 stop:116245 length:3363 start_codon:yes stop_codon:yes gene_type:complete